MLSQKPDWVPELVWRDYLKVMSGPIRQECAAKIDAMLADPDCAVVWKALAKRSSTAKLKGDPSATEILLHRVPIIAAGLPNEDMVVASERRRQGNKISGLASELSAAMEAVRFHDEFRWPWPMENSLSMQMAAKQQSIEKEAGSEYSLEGWERFAAYSPDMALDFFCAWLENIRVSADSWATWKSLVAHPNDPNSARLRFIREMTAFFRQMYASPLRESVAALTRNVYKCDMDSATVAKLAP